MSLKGIIAVGGMSGLYKVISQTKSGYVVESLGDQKKTIIPTDQKVSTLNDICVYTSSGETPLKDILLLMKENQSHPVSPKSDPAELKKYFKTIVPDFDEERVYVSHIKKIISWYHLLKDLIQKEEDAPAENADGEIKPESETINSENKASE
jgi:hypothetical protein